MNAITICNHQRVFMQVLVLLVISVVYLCGCGEITQTPGITEPTDTADHMVHVTNSSEVLTTHVRYQKW